jgi:hypothetical protein
MSSDQPEDVAATTAADNGPGAEAHQPKKRRRAAIACRECRTKKTKCDHIVPVAASDEMLRGMTKTAQMC